jgi:hypothetical protein
MLHAARVVVPGRSNGSAYSRALDVETVRVLLTR